MKRLSALFLTLALTSPGAAHASATDWVEVLGGRVRLVTAGAPNAEGELQGALDVELEPGWKTYWRDPGDTGVPPQLDLTKSRNVVAGELQFPPPQRIDDGFSVWSGYKHPVAFPITFKLQKSGQPAEIEADVFLGICETICIPVQAAFKLDPLSAPDDPDDASFVSAAYAALPAPASPDFGAVALSSNDKELLVMATLPGSSDSAELFIAGENGYMFGTPRRAERDGKTLFSVPIVAKPASSSGDFHYTLAGPSGAVQGTLTLP